MEKVLLGLLKAKSWVKWFCVVLSVQMEKGKTNKIK
jgi:hypothetical protein